MNYSKIIYVSIIFLFYFFLNYFFLFCPTSPSDPLQYTSPALHPSEGFPFFDRIFLWVWIRQFVYLPISSHEIGGIATLFTSSLILTIGSGYFYWKKQYLASSIFIFLFMMSTFTTSYASYTYPMQLLTLVIFTTLILFKVIKSNSLKFIILGIGAFLSIITKIQGIGFLIFSIYLIYLNKSYKKISSSLLLFFIGFFISSITFSLYLIYMDGFDNFLKLFKYFYEGVGEKNKSLLEIQFAGRSMGGMPKFYRLLFNPTFFICFVSSIYYLLKIKANNSIDYLVFKSSIFQILFLLLIYLITQRGGPVIENYFMDFIVLSFFSTSILISNLIKKIKIIQFEKKISLILIFLTIGIFILIIVYFSYFDIYLIKQNSRNLKYFLLIGLFSVVLFYLLKNFKIFKINKSLIISIIVIFLWTCYYGVNAVRNALQLKYESEEYHKIAESLNDLKYNSSQILVSFKFNRPNPQDATFRLKSIYHNFYREKNIVFFYKELTSDNENFSLITDRDDLMGIECKNKYQKNIYYENIFINYFMLNKKQSRPIMKSYWVLDDCII